MIRTTQKRTWVFTPLVLLATQIAPFTAIATQSLNKDQNNQYPDEWVTVDKPKIPSNQIDAKKSDDKKESWTIIDNKFEQEVISEEMLRKQQQDAIKTFGKLKSSSALCTAVWNRQVGKVQQALSQPQFDINERCTDRLEATPLLISVFFADIKITQLLIAANANVNPGEWLTPLHTAAASVSPHAVQIVQELLDAGAKKNAWGRFSHGQYWTALHEAANSVSAYAPQIVQKLLDAGVHRNARDALSETPLHVAAHSSSPYAPQVVQTLLAATSRFNPLKIILPSSSNVYRGIAKHVDEEFAHELRVIFGAAVVTQITQYKMDVGLDKDAVDSYDNTALHYAVRSDSPNAAQVVQKLLEAGLDKDAVDWQDNTALHFAVESDSPNAAKVVQKLLEASVDTTIKNSEGKTAFDIAEVRENQNIIQLFKLQEH